MYMEKEVQRGVALLDERRPGWDSRIDLDRLNLASSVDCVLGLEFGNYGQGLYMLNIGAGAPFGFSLPWGLEAAIAPWKGIELYQALTLTWKHEIMRRRGQKMEQEQKPAPETEEVQEQRQQWLQYIAEVMRVPAAFLEVGELHGVRHYEYERIEDREAVLV